MGVLRWIYDPQTTPSATANGSITFDISKLPQLNTTGFITFPSASVTSLSITISGAASGNGTFSLSDFYGLSFTTPKALNLAAPLIGQTVSTGVSFGSLKNDGSAGDFNLFGQAASAPTGSLNFTLVTNQGAGDALSVTSMVPALPKWAFVLLGLSLLSISYFFKVRSTKLS